MSALNFPPMFKPYIHQWIFFFGLAVIAFALPMSGWLASVGQFILAGNWLLEGQYGKKLSRYWNNKAAVAFSLVLVIYLFALTHTSDLSSGLGLIRIALPFLVLTFLIASSDHQFDFDITMGLLLVFTASVILTTKIGFIAFFIEQPTDFRQLSPFISHIRLGLMIVLSIFLLPWILYQYNARLASLDIPKWVYYGIWAAVMLCIAWLLFFLFRMLSLSAILSFLVVLAFLTFYFLIKAQQKIPAMILGITTLIVLSIASVTTYRLYRLVTLEIPVDLSQLPVYTKLGNPYFHMPELTERENGHLVYILISDYELRTAWNAASELDFDGHDLAGQELKFTLYRYMTSLGLSKDAEGFKALSYADIRAVENGTANHFYTRWPGIIVRIHQAIWELDRFRQGAVPEGHTLGQRLEYWSAASHAFKKYPVFGWGLGDVKQAMDYGFARTESQLSEEFRLRPHNQFVSFLLYFGLLGTVIIVSLIAYTVIQTKVIRRLPFVVFMIIFLVSTLSDDTFETQVGLTFFVFFFVLFNFLYADKKKFTPLP